MEVDVEVFEIGSHVLIELDGVESPSLKIAGYLHGINEDGIFIRATNKDVPVGYAVSDAMRADVRRQLESFSSMALRLECLRRREFAGMLVGRKALVDFLVEEYCDDAVERGRATKPYTFHEYAVPVMTYLGMHKIAVMQLSADVGTDLGVVMDLAGLDTEIGRFLEGGVPPRKGEAVLDDETKDENE
jgi:hypothetical protein